MPANILNRQPPGNREKKMFSCQQSSRNNFRRSGWETRERYRWWLPDNWNITFSCAHHQNVPSASLFSYFTYSLAHVKFVRYFSSFSYLLFSSVQYVFFQWWNETAQKKFSWFPAVVSQSPSRWLKSNKIRRYCASVLREKTKLLRGTGIVSRNNNKLSNHFRRSRDVNRFSFDFKHGWMSHSSLMQYLKWTIWNDRYMTVQKRLFELKWIQ